MTLVASEPETVAWFAVRFDMDTFAIFDAHLRPGSRSLVGGIYGRAHTADAEFQGTLRFQTSRTAVTTRSRLGRSSRRYAGTSQASKSNPRVLT